VAQIGEADDEEKNCQFNARSKYWNITLEEALDFLLPKDLGNIKRRSSGQ
jgi:topoisomerase IA-like protein